MKVEKNVINTWVVNNRRTGRSNQDIENDFKDMLKAKFIDVDDYSNVMDLIYGED